MEYFYPKVSIIIPTYNRASLIKKAVESLLNQTYKNIEILIIDDCSTDDTEKVIKYYRDDRIIYTKLEINQGAPAARNFGISKANGELIAFLDSDDRWESTKLEKQVKKLSEDKKIGVVYTGIKKISSSSTKLLLPQKRKNILNDLLIGNCVGSTSTVLIRKDLLLKVGGFDLSFKSCQDWDLFIRLALITEFDYIQEPLVQYYEHDGERISTNSTSVVDGQVQIHQTYKNQVLQLSRQNINEHYHYIGMNILKAGLLSQSPNHIKVGRKFLSKTIRYPFQTKHVLLYIISLNHKTLLAKILKTLQK